ncbi:phage terminase small subunit [Bacillus sp. FJAT-45350]|uniref:phage terminase small subunit n=1 Tax=Bacillus sp. FJAT-45350 TaxID=2011014 RepID=UPI0015C969E7|nr:phage terminase small subunit [Bacillus sp. FJAT-45350]
MPRNINPNRLEALKIWLKSGREKQPKEIAEELNVSANQVRKWKCIDKWEDIPNTPNKRGAPYRNKNAVGNNGGAPLGNQNAYKHGMFAKWLPNDEETLEIYEATRAMPMLDLLYEEIRIAFTNFIRAQKIMFVRDINDETKVLKKQKKQIERDKNEHGEVESYETFVEEEWEYQHAWDKQAKALTSQAAAMRNITSKVKQYEELLRTLPPEEVKEEQRLRITKMKADIKAAESKAW